MKDIILNEAAKASALISGTSKVDDLRTAVSLVSRYDVLAAQIPPAEAAAHTKKVVKRLFPARQVTEYENYVSYCVENAAARPLISIGEVPITQKELDTVCSCDGIRAKCLAFSLLAIAKYETMRYEPMSYWISNERFFETIARANLTLSGTDTAMICRQLKLSNKIAFPYRRDSLSVHVLFADQDGEPVMRLNEQDYRDLGYCLRAYLGEPYARCEECGRWVKQKKRGVSKRFCEDCAADNHRLVMKEYQRKKRS